MGQSADFFVSYTSADRAWAEWIAWQLEAGPRALQKRAGSRPEGSRPSGCAVPPGPCPRVPDDQQQKSTLGDAQEPVVRRRFADRRRHDGDDVQAWQDDV